MGRWWILVCAVASSMFIGACDGSKDQKQTNQKAPSPFGKYEGLVADSAMVVSAHPLASEIGVAVMRKGGNAADAAVAVQFALAVCFPYAGNIGGGGLLVVRQAGGEVNALDFREKAPAAASRDMYLDGKGEVIPKLSEKGHKAVGVPGSVAGMVALHQRYGRLPWKDLVQPAVELAREGFAATAHEAKWLNEQQPDFRFYNERGQSYLVKDQAWQEGDTIRQEDLAVTLERIRDLGADGFYKGETARLLVEEMERGGGRVTQADLDGYEAKWREPLVGDYRGHRVVTMPPPSSGGLVLVQMLKMVEAYPLGEWGALTPQTIHCMVEAERRAFADRSEYMGDPDFVKVPVAELLEQAYLKGRMADFDPTRATPSDSILPGLPKREPTETTHFSIVDPSGNAISVTTTINSPYGSKVWVKGAGFLLNNEMDDFTAKPGSPNQFGLISNEANAIAPGKRMLSSMTPTIVEKEGKIFLVLGTPGGATIPTSIFQVILDVIDHGASLQEAVDLKRFHHQWQPDEIAIEDSVFSVKVWNALREMGHRICVREPIGRVDAIRRRPAGKLEGAADPRRDDAARGY
ncbi:MAG: gamma-glutamyltransferase [Bacteroidia bacterium]